MHRCLSVNELVLIILRYQAGDRKVHRATLAAVARVSKRFFDPAIDVLWQEQKGINNLLGCLGEGAKEYSWHGRSVRDMIIPTSSLC